ncbi:hypothetical protein [Rhodohalobacter sp. 8-1]|uniref:hypothetical protein n=1 Tax=Rhodohalobacter sp. 8-1 TaxID=3131972 RepID=UPI0030EC45D2
MKQYRQFIALLFFTLFITFNAYADDPDTIFHQGILTNDAGEIVEDGTYEFTFTMYSQETDGSALWSEVQVLEVANGVFNAHLGSVEPLDLPFDEGYWIGVAVDGGSELVPRMSLSAVPYAMHALTVEDGAITGAKLGPDAIQAGNNISVARDADQNVVISAAAPDQVDVFWEKSGNNILYKDGKVGINRNVASTYLDVYSDETTAARFRAYSDSDFIRPVELISGREGGSVTGQRNSLSFRYADIAGSGAITLMGEIGTILTSEDPSAADMLFRLRKPVAPGNQQELMRLTSDGYLGVGTSSPDRTLDVAGDTRVQGNLTFQDGTPQRTAGPVAKGSINADGSINNAVNVAGVVWDSANGWYRIEIEGENYHFSDYATSVTPINDPVAVRSSSTGGELIVEFAGNIQSRFHFVVHSLKN